MFCPNDECPDLLDSGLRAEYRDEITVCPYCETPLVGHRPEPPATAVESEPGKPRVADDEVLEPIIETTDPSEVAPRPTIRVEHAKSGVVGKCRSPQVTTRTRAAREDRCSPEAPP